MDLRVWRRQHRVTLKQLGLAVGASAGHLSFFESGKKKLSPELAKRVESYTHGAVSAASLLGVDELPRRRGVSEDEARFHNGSHSLSVAVSKADVAEARSLGLDVEAIAATGAIKALAEARTQAWREKHRAQFEAKTKYIAENGTLAEQLGLI